MSEVTRTGEHLVTTRDLHQRVIRYAARFGVPERAAIQFAVSDGVISPNQARRILWLPPVFENEAGG